MMYRKHRINILLQRDAMQCGVASLAMVCGWYGRHYSLTDMECHCHVTRQGVSLKGIMDAAKAVGLDSKAGKCTVDDLCTLQEPCILHWRQEHFVVLYKIERNKWFHIADPARGKVRLSRSEFEKDWLSTEQEGRHLGVALFFEPREEFLTMPAPETERKNPSRFLFGFVRRYKAYFANIALGLLLATALQLAMPFLTQGIVDRGIHAHDIGLICLILIGELIIVAGRTATDFIRRWLLLHVAMRINITLKGDFFAKLLRLPMSFFEVKLTGDLLQRVGDHSRVQNFLTEQVLGIMFSIISILVFGVVLLLYSPLLFGVFSLFSLLYALWIRLFMARRRVLDTERFRAESLNSNCTYEFVTTMQEIKLQDCRRRRRWKWEDIQTDLMEVQMKSLRLQQSQEAGSVMINEVKNLLLTAITAIAVVKGSMTLGAMMAVQYIIGQLNSPIGQMMSFAYAWQDVRLSLDRINEIHDSDDEAERTGGEAPPASCFSFELRNVCFRYDLHDPRFALKDLSLTIPAGKTTAVVGASGSGKSTLIKLLLGYYQPEEGEITLGGRNLADYDIDALRRRCGVVMQGGVIFSDTIERNIACDDEEPDHDRLREAMRIACLDSYIASLPLGLNTKIGAEGTGLSQGQRQRILIARAIYRNPDVLMLDEATNSLDAFNERMITEGLQPVLQGRTAVIVAHRLSTVRNADKIVVLKDGRVVEQGTHDELTRLRGHYYELVRNQLELGAG